jgi:hypothetical protein
MLIKLNNIYIKIVILLYWIVILYSLSWWFYISFCVWFSWSTWDVCASDVGQTVCWDFSFLYCLDYTCLVRSFLPNSLCLIICNNRLNVFKFCVLCVFIEWNISIKMNFRNISRTNFWLHENYYYNLITCWPNTVFIFFQISWCCMSFLSLPGT